MVLAVTAATVFALANNLQRGAASVVPLEAGGPVRLVLRLFRAPRWLFGSLLAVLALGLHALALQHGSVIVVQSLLAGGLVIALGVEAAQERRLMRPAEAAGSCLLVAGVILVLAVGRPGGANQVGLTEQLITAAVLAGLAVTGFIGFRLHHRVRLSALIMGATAGACFAVDAVFLKGVADNAGDLDAAAALIDLAGFAAASALGNLVVQRAYQLAPLRFVLPAVTAGDPLAAFVIGKLVLQERLQGGSAASLAVAAGLVAMAAGIAVTTTAGTPAAGPRATGSCGSQPDGGPPECREPHEQPPIGSEPDAGNVASVPETAARRRHGA
jgi:hypothetical protein